MLHDVFCQQILLWNKTFIGQSKGSSARTDRPQNNSDCMTLRLYDTKCDLGHSDCMTPSGQQIQTSIATRTGPVGVWCQIFDRGMTLPASRGMGSETKVMPNGSLCRLRFRYTTLTKARGAEHFATYLVGCRVRDRREK